MNDANREGEPTNGDPLNRSDPRPPTTIRRPVRAFVGVAVAYGSAVGLLYLGELALSVTQSQADFGAYQYVRQLLPVLVLLTLGGIDQVVPRHFVASGPPPWVASWRAVGIVGARGLATGSAVAALLGAASVVPVEFAVSLGVGVSCVAVSEYVAAVLRARDAQAVAALIQQGYRLFLGVCLFGVALSNSGSPAAAIIASVIAAAALAIVVLRPDLADARPGLGAKLRAFRALGWPIAFSGLALGLGDYLDLALLTSRGGGLDVAGSYAAWKLYVCYPWIAAASIVGFVAFPYVVRTLRSTPGVHRLRRMLMLTNRVGIVVLVLGGGIVLAIVDASGAPVPAAAYVLLVTGVLRFAYVLPSAILGAGTRAEELRRFARWCYVSIVLEVLLILIGLKMLDPLLAASIGLLASVVLRVFVANVIVYKYLARVSNLDAVSVE